MTYAEALMKTDELIGRFSSPFGSADKRSIEELHIAVLGKTFKPTNCQNCYHDALLLIKRQLNKSTTMAQERNYALRNGFIIACPIFRGGEVYTNANLTDEVAQEYLAMFPQNAEMFAKIPKGAKSKRKIKKYKRK